jgi:hypothetical protein
MAKDSNILRVEMSHRDGWLVAELLLGDKPVELCRMVSPSADASLRIELLERFETLAGKIVESIVRDDQPDADFTTRSIHMPRAGHG